MHDIKSNFDKVCQTIKSLNLPLFDKNGNIYKPGRKSLFSDLQVISLALTAEFMSLDSENWLFKKIKSDYADHFPGLIDRSRYNRRRRALFNIMENVRGELVAHFNRFEDCFIVDSMPLEVCKLSREKRAKVCRETYQTAPDKGFCATQKMYFYGYKLHGVCSVNGIFHAIELSQASVHDITFLKDVKAQLSDCLIIGDRGYLSSSLQLDLFTTANIRLNTPMRRNQINYKPQEPVFRKTRKRIETLFSQLCDQFMIRRNYAKSFSGFRARILSKITAMTLVQFINKFEFDRPINNLKVSITN